MEHEIHNKYLDDYSIDLMKRGELDFRPFTPTELLIKRIIDIIGGLVGCFLFLIAVILLFIPFLLSDKKDKGQMFYKQKRYGYHGKTFYILKLRTMIMDAEDYLERHPEIKKQYHDNGNKLENDPRVTKIGAFIRNKSIDELPQFWNVLKGDMSLVGPRPILLFEESEYGERLPYLLACKPGITGYWTTHGRSRVLFPERADMELRYLKSHGILFDLTTIFRTISQSIKGSDAY